MAYKDQEHEDDDSGKAKRDESTFTLLLWWEIVGDLIIELEVISFSSIGGLTRALIKVDLKIAKYLCEAFLRSWVFSHDRELVITVDLVDQEVGKICVDLVSFD